jgi:hypothetical protein
MFDFTRTWEILRQFGDANYQQRVWLAVGDRAKHPTCAQALSELLDDEAALERLHDGHCSELSPAQRQALYAALTSIRDLDRSIGSTCDDRRILADYRWPRIRQLCAKAARALEPLVDDSASPERMAYG